MRMYTHAKVLVKEIKEEMYEFTSKSFRILFFKKSLFMLQTLEQCYFSI
jgi:hypothetical protein